jgi:hypothetical protein
MKKTCFAIRKNIFSLLLFLAGALALHFKDDLQSLRRCSHNILNHSKWRRIEKDLPKCLIEGRWLMMGRFTLSQNTMKPTPCTPIHWGLSNSIKSEKQNNLPSFLPSFIDRWGLWKGMGLETDVYLERHPVHSAFWKDSQRTRQELRL